MTCDLGMDAILNATIAEEGVRADRKYQLQRPGTVTAVRFVQVHIDTIRRKHNNLVELIAECRIIRRTMALVSIKTNIYDFKA